MAGFYQNNACIGILEVKCPYSLDNVDITKMHPKEITKHPKFWLEIHDGTPRLKQNHKYFYQIQGELAIMEKPWCDFIVWTEGGILTERIHSDKDLWESYMLPM